MANLEPQNNTYEIVEKLITIGDLSAMSPKDRIDYYNSLCRSEELNPLTKPFEYIKLNGRLVLYANKNCAEQLRNKKGISIYKMEKEVLQDVLVVTAYAKDKNGREDVSTGAVSLCNLKGDALANAYLKAETKAKRRVTLSLAGLGMLDETEVSSIPNAQKVVFEMQKDEVVKESLITATSVTGIISVTDDVIDKAESKLDYYYSVLDSSIIQIFIEKLRSIENYDDLQEVVEFAKNNEHEIKQYYEEYPEFKETVQTIKQYKLELIG